MTPTVTFHIDAKEVENVLREKLDKAIPSAQVAMGMAVYEIVMGNIGDMGADRPSVWPPLSPAYAKRVKRKHATLEVTGALRSAVKMTDTREASIVSISNADCPYALVHQYGGGNNIPARPYFPINENGEVTPFTQAWARDAARQEFARMIS